MPCIAVNAVSMQTVSPLITLEVVYSVYHSEEYKVCVFNIFNIRGQSLHPNILKVILESKLCALVRTPAKKESFFILQLTLFTYPLCFSVCTVLLSLLNVLLQWISISIMLVYYSVFMFLARKTNMSTLSGLLELEDLSGVTVLPATLNTLRGSASSTCSHIYSLAPFDSRSHRAWLCCHHASRSECSSVQCVDEFSEGLQWRSVLFQGDLQDEFVWEQEVVHLPLLHLQPLRYWSARHHLHPRHNSALPASPHSVISGVTVNQWICLPTLTHTSFLFSGCMSTVFLGWLVSQRML